MLGMVKANKKIRNGHLITVRAALQNSLSFINVGKFELQVSRLLIFSYLKKTLLHLSRTKFLLGKAN